MVKTEEQREFQRFDTEAKLQTYVIKRIKELPQVKVIKIADRFTSGISDLLLCYKGIFVAIELKIEYNKPTALQSAFVDEIRQCGGIAHIAYTWGDVKKILAIAEEKAKRHP